MSARAIETRYRGYRFRSRLEARWAVFFDTVGLNWEYEKEGFDLYGSYYLPDFWLPKFKLWAEIKGEIFSDHEQQLCRMLANATGQSVLMLAGIPEPGAYPAYRAEILEGKMEVKEARLNLASLTTSALFLDAVKAARGARFEHDEIEKPKRKTRFRYSYDDESGECSICGRSIKGCYTLCYNCYQDYT